jgi:hypothetical protein
LINDNKNIRLEEKKKVTIVSSGSSNFCGGREISGDKGGNNKSTNIRKFIPTQTYKKIYVDLLKYK